MPGCNTRWVMYYATDGRSWKALRPSFFKNSRFWKSFTPSVPLSILSAFFVMGVSAYHLLKERHIDFFTRSFRIALTFGLIFSIFEVVEGHLHGSDLAVKQPAKFRAAMESHWETGKQAPVVPFFALPDEAKERNSVEILPIPGMLSLLATHSMNGEVKGLKDIPKGERPPVLISFASFKTMVALGLYFVLMTLVGFLKRNRLTESPIYLKLMIYSIPLPYIAVELGWVLAEVGRQPWIVYGVMKTSEAFSPVAMSQVLTSLITFILIYGILGAIGYTLIFKTARKGPGLAR